MSETPWDFEPCFRDGFDAGTTQHYTYETGEYTIFAADQSDDGDGDEKVIATVESGEDDARKIVTAVNHFEGMRRLLEESCYRETANPAFQNKARALLSQINEEVK